MLRKSLNWILTPPTEVGEEQKIEPLEGGELRRYHMAFLFPPLTLIPFMPWVIYQRRQEIFNKYVSASLCAEAALRHSFVLIGMFLLICIIGLPLNLNLDRVYMIIFGLALASVGTTLAQTLAAGIGYEEYRKIAPRTNKNMSS